MDNIFLPTTANRRLRGAFRRDCCLKKSSCLASDQGRAVSPIIVLKLSKLSSYLIIHLLVVFGIIAHPPSEASALPYISPPLRGTMDIRGEASSPPRLTDTNTPLDEYDATKTQIFLNSFGGSTFSTYLCNEKEVQI